MNGEAFAPSEPGSFRIPAKPKDWFSYPVAFTAVGETSTLTGTVNIDAGSDFYMTALTQFSIVDGATAVLTAQSVVIPTVKLLITDTGSNRQLMNAPVPLSLIALVWLLFRSRVTFAPLAALGVMFVALMLMWWPLLVT